jgi:hypothetical protein
MLKGKIVTIAGYDKVNKTYDVNWKDFAPTHASTIESTDDVISHCNQFLHLHGLYHFGTGNTLETIWPIFLHSKSPVP